MEKLKILAVPPNHGGCAYYRVISPMNKLAELFSDKVEIRFNDNPLELDLATKKFPDFEDPNTLKDMRWADVIYLHTISSFGGPYTGMVAHKAKDLKKFLHYDTDDLLTDLFPEHRLYQVYTEQKLDELCKYIYYIADLTTVTQRKFAERVKPFCGGVLAIVKNAIDYNLPCWNLPKVNLPKGKPIRVGWVGGIHHEEDIKEFAGVPHFVNMKAGFENVFWNAYGRPEDPRGQDKEDWQHNVWDNYEKTWTKGMVGRKNYKVYNALPPDRYGAFYSDMDIAVAPLAMNNFNDSKSEIKVAECGRYKIPLIASDVGCYNETIKNGETGYIIPVDAGRSVWVSIISKCARDPKHVREMGENLHKITEEYFNLNKVSKFRLDLYSESFRMLSERNKEAAYNIEWRNT